MAGLGWPSGWRTFTVKSATYALPFPGDSLLKIPAMAIPASKFTKIATLIQVIGGFVAAIVLGYSCLNNLVPGQPLTGTPLLLAILTMVALVYSGYFTWKLGKLVENKD